MKKLEILLICTLVLFLGSYLNIYADQPIYTEQIVYVDYVTAYEDHVYGSPLTAYALTIQQDQPIIVRVGLISRFANATSVQIGNQSIYVGHERNGEFVSERVFNNETGTFTIEPTNQFFISLDRVFSNYGYARQAADQYIANGHAAVPTLLNIGEWSVFVGGFAAENQAQSTRNSIGGSVVSAEGVGVLLSDGLSRLALFFNEDLPMQLISADGTFTSVGDRSYRGHIEIFRNASSVTVVNIVDMEEYLKSVVPSEMYASWHIEALKAQAIAARTYTLTSMRRGHGSSPFDLCDTTHCQVYVGVGNEAPSTTAAVNATRGYALFHNNTLIDALYFSSSGGVTENSEDVWIHAFPYLRSVPDPYDTTGRVWTRTFTYAEINSLLASAQINIGTVVDMRVGEFTEGGRVNELMIVGTNGVHAIRRESVRTFFSGSVGGSLESRNFRIVGSTNDPETTIDSEIIESPEPAEIPEFIEMPELPVEETQYTEVHIQSSVTVFTVELNNVYVITDNDELTRITSENRSVILVENDREIINIPIISNISNVRTFANDVTIEPRSSGYFVLEGRGWGHGVGMSQHGANGMANAGHTHDQILKHYYTGVEIRNIRR